MKKAFFVIVEIATVTTAYNAVSAEQLSLSPGQLILVKRKHPDGWWEGELQVRTLKLHCTVIMSTNILTEITLFTQARGKKRQSGLFPGSHVKILDRKTSPASPVTEDVSSSAAETVQPFSQMSPVSQEMRR